MPMLCGHLSVPPLPLWRLACFSLTCKCMSEMNSFGKRRHPLSQLRLVFGISVCRPLWTGHLHTPLPLPLWRLVFGIRVCTPLWKGHLHTPLPPPPLEVSICRPLWTRHLHTYPSPSPQWRLVLEFKVCRPLWTGHLQTPPTPPPPVESSIRVQGTQLSMYRTPPSSPPYWKLVLEIRVWDLSEQHASTPRCW